MDPNRWTLKTQEAVNAAVSRAAADNNPELAEKIGSDARQVSRYENGRVAPSLDVLARIGEVLDVTVDHLLYEAAERRPLTRPTSQLDARLTDLDQLTEHFEMKFGRIDDRFDRIDARFERTDERFALLLNARTAEQRADTAQLRADFEGSLRRMQTVLLSAFLTLAGVLIALSVFGPS